MAHATVLSGTNIEEYGAQTTYLDPEVAIENDSLSYSSGNILQSITGWITIIHLVK